MQRHPTPSSARRETRFDEIHPAAVDGWSCVVVGRQRRCILAGRRGTRHPRQYSLASAEASRAIRRAASPPGPKRLVRLSASVHALPVSFNHASRLAAMRTRLPKIQPAESTARSSSRARRVPSSRRVQNTPRARPRLQRTRGRLRPAPKVSSRGTALPRRGVRLPLSTRAQQEHRSDTHLRTSAKGAGGLCEDVGQPMSEATSQPGVDSPSAVLDGASSSNCRCPARTPYVPCDQQSRHRDILPPRVLGSDGRMRPGTARYVSPGIYDSWCSPSEAQPRLLHR